MGTAGEHQVPLPAAADKLTGAEYRCRSDAHREITDAESGRKVRNELL
jgi:hypothetical protein